MKKVSHILLYTVFSTASPAFAQNVILEAGYKTQREHIPEASAPLYENCYCETKFTRNNDHPVWGMGGYVQGTVQFDKVFVSLQLGAMQWHNQIEGTQRTDYYQPHPPSWWGEIVHYREYTISYHDVSTILNVSPGIGVNVLKPTSKFRLGPVVKLHPQFLISRKHLVNNVTEHYRHSENPPDPYTKVDVDTYNDSHDAERFIKLHDFGKDIFNRFSSSAGISSSGILFRKLGYSLEAGYQLQSFSRIQFGDIKQKSSYYFQLGIAYQVK